jgi:hypothetical protein
VPDLTVHSAVLVHVGLKRKRHVQFFSRTAIELSVQKSDLSRSPLLSDMHSVDPEGRVELQFGSSIWKVWVANDP